MKKAVILFNLGGPDSLQSVKPFLFNLFNDKAIIAAPALIRYLIATLISSRREKVAQGIYSLIGGKSPIVEQTEAQARALEQLLAAEGDYKTFISMRYWHPFSSEVIEKVKQYAPDEIILLPLYPQFSTTTSASSIADWQKQAKKQNLNVPTRTICCYPWEENFIDAHVALINKALSEIKNKENLRILFSAHGLPKKIIDAGDPYQWQVEQGAAKIVEKLNMKNLDWKVSYQSRVGPLEWIGPSTDAEIIRAGQESKGLMIVPIAFVSEHSETLVELDIEYKHLAEKNNVTEYSRVPTVSIQSSFIKALAAVCKGAGPVGNKCSNENKRLCPNQFAKCPMA